MNRSLSPPVHVHVAERNGRSVSPPVHLHVGKKTPVHLHIKPGSKVSVCATGDLLILLHCVRV